MSPPPRPAPAPLRAVLLFSAGSNFATGLATVGIFFLTESAYAFGTAENYLLALLLGVSYALAAWRAGPLVRAIARPGGTSSRGALAVMSLALAALCVFAALVRARWAPFLFLVLYSPITGVFWPLVESYLSGGRRGESLRRAIGAFNVTWSGSMALALVGLAPLIARRPFDVLLGLALVHVLCLAALPAFGRDPARHVEEEHPTPPEYRALLAGHQVLLVASYVAMFALAPWLPALLERLEVPPPARAALGSVWGAARVVAFYALGRWSGWHGARWVGWGGALLLALGFGAVALSPELGARGAGLAALVLGQIAFGLALAALYTANLYYTLEVGAASVDAGGSHEGLIGLGYTLGPLCGAAAGGAAALGWIPAGSADAMVLVLIEALILGAALWARRAVASR